MTNFFPGTVVATSKVSSKLTTLSCYYGIAPAYFPEPFSVTVNSKGGARRTSGKIMKSRTGFSFLEKLMMNVGPMQDVS